MVLPRKTPLLICGPWDCRLRQLREERCLKMSDVAKGAGVAIATVCFAERGRNVRLDIAVKIAAFFGLKVEDVWRSNDAENR